MPHARRLGASVATRHPPQRGGEVRVRAEEHACNIRESGLHTSAPAAASLHAQDTQIPRNDSVDNVQRIEVVKGIGKYKYESDYRKAMAILELRRDHDFSPPALTCVYQIPCRLVAVPHQT